MGGVQLLDAFMTTDRQELSFRICELLSWVLCSHYALCSFNLGDTSEALAH